MDDIVLKALKKWPNVPHCYGWLALDARGNWRMRDQAAQDHQLAGDKLAHVALIAFINRNYASDAQGRWYFQNGPQRVYVNLEAAPYIARSDPQHGFVLHTGAILDTLSAVWLSDAGQLLLAHRDGIAALDDRDLAQCLPALQHAGRAISDAQLLDWLAGGSAQLHYRQLPLQRIAHSDIARHFGFISQPQAD